VDNITFPKTKEPVLTLQKKHPEVKIVLSNQAKITYNNIMIGFYKMLLPKRKLWKLEIDSGAFQIVCTD
jgi:hypothetical protein